MSTNFASNLKMLRKEYGITQSILAEVLQTTVKTISHWETGYSEPSIKQILELAEYFSVELDDLLR